MRELIKVGDRVVPVSAKHILKKAGLIFPYGNVTHVGIYFTTIKVPYYFSLLSGRYVKHSPPLSNCTLELFHSYIEVENEG